MMCFNNACWKPDCNLAEIIEEIEEACLAWDVDSIHIRNVDEMDLANKILLLFLKNKHSVLAYKLNRAFLKRRYH